MIPAQLLEATDCVPRQFYSMKKLAELYAAKKFRLKDYQDLSEDLRRMESALLKARCPCFKAGPIHDLNNGVSVTDKQLTTWCDGNTDAARILVHLNMLRPIQGKPYDGGNDVDTHHFRWQYDYQKKVAELLPQQPWYARLAGSLGT